MEKKYIVVGGRVESKNDGDIHHVDALELCRLYQVNPKECYLVEGITGLKGLPELPVLTPRYDGHYSLKTLGHINRPD